MNISSRYIKGFCRAAIVAGILLALGCAGTSRYGHAPDLDAGGPGANGHSTDRDTGGAGPKRLTLSFHQSGLASYYAKKFNGRKTASGERYNMHDLTAAHPKLPFGTRVRVTNLSNNLSVVVRINDRGPFRKGRVIDVSYAAAKKIGLLSRGIAKVKVEAVK